MSANNYLLLALVQLLNIHCGDGWADQRAGAKVPLAPPRECPICSIEAVATAKENMNNLSHEDFLCFIGTFDDSCRTNVEYSEFSNEVLFAALVRYPNYMVQYVADYPNATTTEFVLAELTAPVHDGISVERCREALAAVDGPAEAKKRILESLERINPRR